MSEDERVETPEVSFSLSGDRLTLRDEAGGGEVLVELDGEPSLTQATTSWFDVPMDAAVSFESESLRLPHNTTVWLRESGGESYGLLTEQQTTVDADGTFADISAAMKVVAYIESGPVQASIRTGPGPETAVLEFEHPTRVVLGVRSIHEEPTTTMVVPDRPRELMEAVSHLGSAIKEWSPERSWPTIRGHPPAIVAGETLDIPDQLSVPDTGVTLAVPADIAEILRIAPLAYYLGATVVPGERAELRICGHAEPLGSGRALENAVDRLLARCLVLDSLVRVDGYFSIPRHEYEALAGELPFYPPELYDERADRQLLEYLEVPFSTIEPFIPRWSAEATLRPSVDDAEALPYLLAKLSRIRVTADAQPRADATDEPFSRFSTSSQTPSGVAWLPETARNTALASERRQPEQGSILIVDDAAPSTQEFERTNWEGYEVDGQIPDPAHRASVTRAELTAAFENNPLYVHYGGAVTQEGFVCTDGVLPFDALSATTVGALSFQWPNAELAALEKLAEAAVTVCVTETEMSAAVAVAFGKYLVLGFPTNRSAEFVGVADQMRYLGDASLSLVDHANGALPTVFDAEPDGSGGYSLSFCCSVTRPGQLGSVGGAKTEKSRELYHLNGSNAPTQATFTVADLVKMAADDLLFRFDGPVPDEIPIESVIHTSREGWVDDDASQHSQTEQRSRR